MHGDDKLLYHHQVYFYPSIEATGDLGLVFAKQMGGDELVIYICSVLYTARQLLRFISNTTAMHKFRSAVYQVVSAFRATIKC